MKLLLLIVISLMAFFGNVAAQNKQSDVDSYAYKITKLLEQSDKKQDQMSKEDKAELEEYLSHIEIDTGTLVGDVGCIHGILENYSDTNELDERINKLENELMVLNGKLEISIWVGRIRTYIFFLTGMCIVAFAIRNKQNKINK